MRSSPSSVIETRKPPEGTQAVHRAVELLKTLALHRSIGWRLIDLGRHCGLDDSTTHRLMACLSALRLVKQRGRDRRYVLGPLVYELALAMPAHTALSDACRKHLARIARRTGWVASLHLRAVDESVCIARTEIASMQLMIEIGSRRPLAGFAIGAAMLIRLPEKEQRALVARGAAQLNAIARGRGSACRRIWQRSRALGAGVSLGDVIPGVASVGVAINDVNGLPFAAIGVTGPREEFTQKRITETVALLREEVERIESEQAGLIAELSP